MVHISSTVACRDSYILNYIGSMYWSGSRSSSASWCSTVCTTKHPSTLSTSASLSPVSPPDNIFALPAEVFSSCLAIVSAVMVGGLFLWPTLRYGTGYQTVWEIRPPAETPSSVHWRRFYFQLTRVHSTLELFGRCTLQVYLLAYLSMWASVNDSINEWINRSIKITNCDSELKNESTSKWHHQHQYLCF